jgi:hypothetical protein
LKSEIFDKIVVNKVFIIISCFFLFVIATYYIFVIGIRKEDELGIHKNKLDRGLRKYARNKNKQTEERHHTRLHASFGLLTKGTEGGEKEREGGLFKLTGRDE